MGSNADQTDSQVDVSHFNADLRKHSYQTMQMADNNLGFTSV